jgi:hypothetical protein
MGDDRKRKEAAALRANLLKRKAQQRAREEKGRGRPDVVRKGDRDNRSVPESIAGTQRRS